MKKKWRIILLIVLLLLILLSICDNIRVREENTTLSENLEEEITLILELQDTIIMIKVRFYEKEIILLDSIDKTKKIVLENFTPQVRIIEQAENQKTVNKEDILGTWLLCNVHDSSEVVNHNNIPGMKRCKLITPASFMNIDYNRNSKGLHAVMLGSYKIEDGVYTETIQYAGKGYEGFVDNVNPFEIIFDSAYMSLIPIEKNPCTHDVWRRESKPELLEILTQI